MSDTTKKQFRLSDQVIGQIRELLQLSMLTNSNFVDHCRAMRLEESDKTDGSMILAKDYVDGWNKMALELIKQAEAKAEEMGTNLAADDDEADATEVVISRDPETGKLVGIRQPSKTQN